MGDPCDYGPMPDGAELLAETGGHQYFTAAWVYRRPPGGQHTYYSTIAAWRETPAAQLAERDQQIMRRDQEIAHLRERVAELEVRLALKAPATAPQQEELPDDRRPTTDTQMETCGVDGCQVQKPAGRSINMHRARMHRYEIETRDGWRCADCESDAYAPDLHDRTRCMRCMAQRAPKNGKEVHV